MVSIDGAFCEISGVIDGHSVFSLLYHSFCLTEKEEQEKSYSLTGPLFSQRVLGRAQQRLPRTTLTDRA